MIDDPELLSAYLDGEVTDAEAMRIETHLSECPDCAQELEGLNWARSAVRSLPLLAPPTDVFDAIPIPSAQGPARGRFLMPVAAAVAAIVVIGGVVSGVVAASDAQEIPIESVATQHAVGSAGQPGVLLVSVPMDGIGQ